MGEKSEKTEKKTEEKKEGKTKTIVKKRTVDKWKKKTWFTIIAPKEFDRKELGSTIAEKEENVMNRTIWANVRDLTNQPKKQHISILFKVNEVKGSKAYAIAVGHEIREGYLRKFIRRRSSKIEMVQTVTLKSGDNLRVKTVVVTGNKSDRNRETDLRKVVKEVMEQSVSNQDTQQVISELVFGSIPQKIFDEAKRILQIKRIEITKSSIMPGK
jgi:small subunit ribosomal protein S3Ae